jgi:hypothetical protein
MLLSYCRKRRGQWNRSNLPRLGEEQLQALDELYRTTRKVRLRTRAQMVRLSAEHHVRKGACANYGTLSTSIAFPCLEGLEA